MALTYSKFEKFTCNLVRSIFKIGFAGMHQLKESLVVMKLLWRLRLKLVLRCKTTALKFSYLLEWQWKISNQDKKYASITKLYYRVSLFLRQQLVHHSLFLFVAKRRGSRGAKNTLVKITIIGSIYMSRLYILPDLTTNRLDMYL